MRLDQARLDFLTGYFSTNHRQDKTKKAYTSDTKQFVEFIGGSCDIRELKNTQIESWAGDLKSQGYSPASIRRKLVVLKVFCSYWVRSGLMNESPFWRVKIDCGKVVQLPRTLSECEITALLLNAQTTHTSISRTRSPDQKGTYLLIRNVALLEVLFATGLRVGEIASLNLSDFVRSEGSIKVRGKGGKERLAFIVDKLSIKILEDHYEARSRIESESCALFLNIMGDRLSSQGIADVVTQWRKASGIIRHVTPHMFRHTVATFLLRNGTDIRVVQEFLGHASISTTQRYTHVAKDHLIRELEARHPSMALRAGKGPPSR